MTAAGIQNAALLAAAATRAGVPYAVAVALMSKESNGRNIYGHDKGGTFTVAGDKAVTLANWAEFRQLVIVQGRQGNGVGPAQITWPGFFLDMEKKGLRPWVAADNMYYGLALLKGYYVEGGSWAYAGTRYNGSKEYGADLAKRVTEWEQRLAAVQQPPVAARVTVGEWNIRKNAAQAAGSAQLGKVLPEADVWGLCEVESVWQRLLLKAKPGWDVFPVLGAGASVPIVWRTAVFKASKKASTRIHPGQAGVTPARYITEVTFVHRPTGLTLDHKHGQSVHHVEVGGRVRDYAKEGAREVAKYGGQPDRARAWFTGMRDRLAAAPGATVATGDFNVSYQAEVKLPRARRVPWFPLTLLTPYAKPFVPAGGTHVSGRGIDWTLVRGPLRVLSQRKLDRGTSDHNPVLTEMEIS